MKNNRRRNKNMKKEKIVIRCKLHSKPVFDNEVCDKFNSKISTNNDKNCSNCTHSF